MVDGNMINGNMINETNNMGNGPKHCSKLINSTFTIVIDPCEDNYG